MKFPGQLSCSVSLTGFGYEKPGGTDNTVLVILGLARPFDKYGAYDPARCYVLGIKYHQAMTVVDPGLPEETPDERE